MAQYPIKMLKDENGTPFVPLVAPEAVKDNQGTDWQALIDKKLEKTNIIAGDNITLSVSGNDITINSQAGGTSDYTTLTNKPSLDTTSDQSLNPSKEEINGEISLHKIAKTGNYKDLLYKPIIPITFTDNTKSDYSASELPSWQVSLLQQMINEYRYDNNSINNYILKVDGLSYSEDISGESTYEYSNEGKNNRLYTFKKSGPIGNIPHAFQFVGPTSLSYNKYPEWGYGVIGISNEGILIYCDNNYRVTEVCQRYGLYDEAEKNTNVSIDVVPTNLSSATAFIATEDHQPATKKYVDDSINGIVESGSNTNGSWTKWADGTMICTSVKLFENVSVTNSWGNLYETPELSLGNFPQSFISTPEGINCIMINNGNSSGKGSGGFVEYIIGTTNTSWGKTAIAKPTSVAAANIGLSLIAIGKWK